jgi:hypothetical protein
LPKVKLFMVHWLPAITPSAPSSALVMQVEVSTLPATTEAGGFGFSMEPGGMMTLQRLQAPGVERNVVVHQRAEHIQHRRHAHRGGALKLLVCCRLVPVKSTTALRLAASTRTATLICAPLSSGSVNVPVLQARDGAAHRLLGVVLHMAHVGLHHGQAELVHHLAQFLHAFFVGGNLRLQVGQVLLRVAADCGCHRCPAAPASRPRAARHGPPA